MANKGSFVKGQKRPNQGKRGPAKTTVAAKEAIALAAEKLGGTDRLVDWAKEDPANERIFWGQIYPKLLPLQVSGEGGQALIVKIMRIGEDGDDKKTGG